MMPARRNPPSRFAFLVVAAILCSLSAIHGQTSQPAGVDPAVARAIADFTPHWMPERRDIPGVVVYIRPVASGEQDRGDDGLLTAEYLRHMIQRAGGKAILERFPRDGRVERGKSDSDCALAIEVCYTTAGGEPGIYVVPIGGESGSDSSMELARSMAEAAGVPEAKLLAGLSAGESAVPARFPTCRVRFQRGPSDPPFTGRSGPVHREHARILYNGVKRYCEQSARFTSDDEPPLTTAPAFLDPSSLRVDRTGTLARSVFPEGDLPLEQADWFCQAFARRVVSNRSLVHFVPSASVAGGTVVLEGTTNLPALSRTMEAALRAVGVADVRNEIRTLPDVQRLGADAYGVCVITSALMYEQPGETGTVQSEVLFGEPVFLLDRRDGHYLLHASDGYWGWARESVIRPMTSARFSEYTAGPHGVMLDDVQTDAVLLPRGARVCLGKRQGTEWVVWAPDGGELTVPADQVKPLDDQGPLAAARVEAALNLLYVPYVFGGRSPLGLDCSGLVHNVSARTGQAVARDAWQQAFDGTLSATWWQRAGLRAGDIVYFIQASGRIYHTGVAISPTHVVHSAPPAVQIGSLVPGDRLYNEQLDRGFFMAKRP